MSIIFLLVFFILLVCVLYYPFTRTNMELVKSDIDNREYLVMNLDDKQQASNMLGKIVKNVETLILYLNNNKQSNPKYTKNIEILTQKMQNAYIAEGANDGIYTSYSVNKGEQLIFCIRSRKTKNKIHDLNLMMYVVLHEMAHVASPTWGHDSEFKHIFAFLAQTAIQLKLYEKIDFQNNPVEYCGLTINSSIV